MPFKGYKQTVEHKSKRRFDNRKNCILSDIHKLRIAKSLSGRIMTLEHRRKIAIASTGRIKLEDERKKLSNAAKLRIFPKYRTTCEILVNEFLNSKFIFFKQQELIENITKVDFYIPKLKVCIFVDGDYWHGNPIKYPFGSILRGGLKVEDRWGMDLRINNDLCRCGYNVIRIWETEIRKNDFRKIEEKLKCLYQN